MKSFRERLLSRLIINAETGCLLWTGAKATNGYGRTYYQGVQLPVHRAMYEMFVGAIPDGLELDHLCRVKHCASPAHLEAVTHGENMRRSAPSGMPSVNSAKTHCPQGHPYDEANTYWTSIGSRKCRACGGMKPVAA